MLHKITQALKQKAKGYQKKSHQSSFVYRDDSVAVRYEDINKATNSLVVEAEDYVMIQAYKFVKGKKSADELIDVIRQLNQKAMQKKQKIKVYFLLNKRIGPAAIATGKYNDPRYQHQLSVFEELAKECAHLDIQCTYHKHYGFDSYHSKYIIVDGKKGMVRGCDFGDSERFETNLTVDGPIVKHMIEDFCDGWNADSTLKLNPDYFYHEDENNVGETNDRIILLSKNESKLANSSDNPLKIAILTAIQNAEKSISIMTPNLNDKEIIDALIKAAKNGIKIKIYMGKFHNEQQEQWYGGTNLKWMDYLKSETYKTPIEIRWATHDHKLVENNTPQAMHGKVMIFDDAYVITGSSALDKQALCNSREADVFVQSETLAARYNAIFTKEFDNGFRYHSIREQLANEITEEVKRLDFGFNPFKTSNQYKKEAYKQLQVMIIDPLYRTDTVNVIIDKWLTLKIKDLNNDAKPIEVIMKEQRSIFSFFQSRTSKSDVFIKSVRDKYGDSTLNREVLIKKDRLTRLKAEDVKTYSIARHT